jgi:L-fucose isomerase-like protein
MKRRDFLGGIALGAAGSMMVSDSASARPNPRIEFAKGPSDRPLDIQIAVKPVFFPLIHSDVWEGPCRASAGKGPEQERADARSRMKTFADNLKANLNQDFRLLGPVYMEYAEDFLIRPEELSKLEPDSDKTDVYILQGGMSNYTAEAIAEKYKKPVVVPGGHFVAADAVASLNAMGLEGHTVFGLPELNHLFSLLKTRKVFQQTKILIVTDRGLPPIPVRSCMDVNMLKDKFGIGSHFVSYREFANEMDKVIGSKEWGAKAEDRAGQLINNAEQTHIDKQYVKRSFEFYYAVKNMMQKYGCNAFTVECFELCASRLAEKYKITPCLVHTLLKDEGIASACEADLNALLAMRLLMSVSKKSSFMGNPVAASEDRIYLYHSVPGIKMAGYDKPDLPYDLRHFVESRWGTKVMIDFTKLDERTVTLARFDPFGTKIYLAKGEIVDCTGYRKGVLSATRQKEEISPWLAEWLLENDKANLIGCTLAAHIKVSDAGESMRKLREFGSHLAMVYGDHTGEINELADMLGFEVVYAT